MDLRARYHSTVIMVLLSFVVNVVVYDENVLVVKRDVCFKNFISSKLYA